MPSGTNEKCLFENNYIREICQNLNFSFQSGIVHKSFIFGDYDKVEGFFCAFEIFPPAGGFFGTHYKKGSAECITVEAPAAYDCDAGNVALGWSAGTSVKNVDVVFAVICCEKAFIAAAGNDCLIGHCDSDGNGAVLRIFDSHLPV